MASDAGSTGPRGLLVLFVVAGVHVGFLCLLFQDLPKLILSDTAEEGGPFVWLLDHPLKGRTGGGAGGKRGREAIIVQCKHEIP